MICNYFKNLRLPFYIRARGPGVKLSVAQKVQKLPIKEVPVGEGLDNKSSAGSIMSIVRVQAHFAFKNMIFPILTEQRYSEGLA